LAGSRAYVDASAYLKLLFNEHETPTLEAVITEWPDLVSSELLEVEMHRAAYRAGLPAADCDRLLDAVSLVAFDESIRRASQRIAHPLLRAGDAIHLATAASLGIDLGVLFAYDKRMLDGALLEGLRAWAPKPGI
jgi:predicted nucleic acid-binding protein